MCGDTTTRSKRLKQGFTLYRDSQNLHIRLLNFSSLNSRYYLYKSRSIN